MDAKALYLYTMDLEMPVGKYRRIESYDIDKFKHDLLNKKIFGFFEVDIKVPDNLKEYFSEMTPILKNCSVPFSKIGEHMQQHYILHPKLKYDDKSKINWFILWK